MPAAQTTLTVEQGTTWSHGWRPEINAVPVADPSWTVKAQVRKSAKSTTVLHEWSTDAGNASVDGDGVVLLSLDPADSTAWTWAAGVYDVEISKAGVTYRIAEGDITVSPEVTR